MNGAIEDCSEFAEIDPSGRYGRYDDILGRGASKTVYRGFDEYEGIEVAWNQVKLRNFTRNPEDLQKFFREIHLLKTLNHENIMKFYSSWVDTNNLSINFVTELFTSGTLRQYRLRHRRVNIKAVKQWCRQILKGLLYLHTRSPPIIHRDLKCDNIFINGHQGEVKIGDLGLAAILRKTHAVRCVGTPEFMAPELYDEEYNELVDIYAFGMCVLEMVTLDFPYSECTHPAQIYKKVISGKKPEAYYLVKEPEVRDFVDKCLANVACRLTALELLQDPFLQDDIDEFDMSPIDYYNGYDEAAVFLRQQPLVNEYGDFPGFSVGDSSLYHPQICEIDLFADEDNEIVEESDISIKGKKSGDDGIFLRLRIADAEGRIRNIYFPFEIAIDTAHSVAAEMVSELDIMNQDVAKIAEMIDAEITALVPNWKTHNNLEESLLNGNTSEEIYGNCASIQEIVSKEDERSHELECSDVRSCSSIHGRFEEITYKVGEEEDYGNGVSEISWCSENEMRRELRWLKARQTIQLTRVRDQSLGKSSFDVGSLAPSTLHRAISLPVDAVDI